MSCALEFRMQLSQGEHFLDVAARLEVQSLGVLGPSGAGKTSLLECLAGWRQPESGFVKIGERVLYDSERGISLPKQERGIGYLPQDVLLFPHWSVRQNIRAALVSQVSKSREQVVGRACEVLDLVPLLNRSAAGLSGGERQRVGLARALVAQPDLLLLDEPLGSLDLPLRRRILPYLIRTRDEFSIPMVVVSHDPTEVKALCDEALVIEKGRVIEQGRPSSILTRVSRKLDPLAGVENVLAGRVIECGAGVAVLHLAGAVELRLPSAKLSVGERVLFGLRAKDILISTVQPEALSARNILAARVVGMQETEDDLLLSAALLGAAGEDAEVLHVELTINAARELGLAVGKEIKLVIKAHACSVLSTTLRG
ncbi:MAG: molybdate transport system ATP-binding protein [Planctomycetota bacterium]|jgi:molybdate transport system ATP-binding protein